MVNNRYAAVRRASGLRLYDAAACLNTTIGCLSKYETGRTEPSAETLRAMSRLFGVSADFLLCQSDIPLPPSLAHRSVMWRVPGSDREIPFEAFLELALLLDKYFPEL